jgi:hypothetical protein
MSTFQSEVIGRSSTSAYFDDQRLRPEYSVPLAHFGYPTPYKLIPKKPTTAGWLLGRLAHFPQETFWTQNGKRIDSIEPVFVGGDLNAYPHFRNFRREI